MHGCGHATASKLQGIGIHTIGDAASSSLSLLQDILGNKAGLYIHNRANGIDDSPVEYQERDAKSYSNETTTVEDINVDNYQSLAVPILESLCSKLSSRLQKDHVCGATVSVMVKTGSFRRHSRQTTLYSSTNSKDEIFSHAQSLMQSLLFEPDGLFSSGEVLRLIGVGVSNLDNGENRQMTLDEWAAVHQSQVKQKERSQKLEHMLERIQKKYGTGAIRKGQ